MGCRKGGSGECEAPWKVRATRLVKFARCVFDVLMWRSWRIATWELSDCFAQLLTSKYYSTYLWWEKQKYILTSCRLHVISMWRTCRSIIELLWSDTCISFLGSMKCSGHGSLVLVFWRESAPISGLHPCMRSVTSAQSLNPKEGHYCPFAVVSHRQKCHWQEENSLI